VNPKILFIFPKRGLYTLTKCTSCGHCWECEKCDAKLVTYKKWAKNLELVCHQCQSYYSYPISCPNCHNNEIVSLFGGIEELVEILKKESGSEVFRYDLLKENKDKTFGNLAVTTRIFDPSIDYGSFEKVIMVQSESLLASPDYLVQEDIHKQLLELISTLGVETELSFDTNSPELDLFTDLGKVGVELDKKLWHQNFLKKEAKAREMFDFPPFANLLLITTQQKNKDKALETINFVHKDLLRIKSELTTLKVSPHYPAKFLKRKGMFSYHILVRFPRGYKEIGKLREEIMQLSAAHGLQVRLNPKHLF
jgi:primosomal protein N' (replication factor Y) (superfamily II helicase)